MVLRREHAVNMSLPGAVTRVVLAEVARQQAETDQLMITLQLVHFESAGRQIFQLFHSRSLYSKLPTKCQTISQK